MGSARAGSDILWWITVTLAGLCVVLGIVALMWPKLLGLRLMKAAGLLTLVVVCLITLNEIGLAAHQALGWVVPLLIQLGLLLGLAGVYLVLRQRPQARGPALACAMLAGGATTLSWLMWQLEEPTLEIADRKHHIAISVGDQAPSEANPAGLVWTDLGHGVNLYTCSTELPWLRQEAATLEAEYAARVIRVAHHDKNYNCHGWTLILVLGILALVMGGAGLILGPIAWIMGNADMKKYRDGTMDPEGEQQTNIGRILGMVATLLHAVGCVVGGVLIILWLGLFAFLMSHDQHMKPVFEKINDARPVPEEMPKAPDFPELEKQNP
jgi:hypothetical protein